MHKAPATCCALNSFTPSFAPMTISYEVLKHRSSIWLASHHLAGSEEVLSIRQLGLDRIELPESAKQPVSRKRTRSEADSPASSSLNAPSPVGGLPGAQVPFFPGHSTFAMSRDA